MPTLPVTHHPFDLSMHQLSIVHESPITDADLDLLFLYILRLPQVFSEARQHLRIEYLDPNAETPYALFWVSVLALAGQYQSVTYEMVINEVQRRAHVGQLSDDVIHSVIAANDGGLAWSCMNTHIPEQLNVDHARDLLRRFLHERSWARPLVAITSQARGSYPQNLMDILKAAADQYRTIEGIREIPIGSVMPAIGDALPPPIEYVPTGLSFIDPYIRGQRRGDCNGILGVYGAGKTSLGIQLALENAQNFYNVAREANRQSEVSLFMSYEEPESKINPRIWAYAAKIRRDKLEQLTDWNQLTTPSSLEPYDREIAGSPELVYSECERWEQAREWMNRSFRSLDMSGSERFPGVGAGYVDEIVAMVERLLDQMCGAPLGALHIDYAGLICRRYMSLKNMSDDRLRHLLATLGDDLRRRVAEPFKCTVWLLHQISGDQAKSSSTKLLTHLDASESKAFAENMAICGCLGTEDMATGCRLLNWSKRRYFRGEAGTTMPTLQISGRFGGLIDVSNRFVADSTTNSFIDPQARTQLEGEAQPQRRTAVRLGPAGMRNLDMMADLEG